MKTTSKIQFILLTLVLLVAIPFSVFAVDGKIKIGQTATTTFPISLNQSGSYILTSDLVVSTNAVCIHIQADNVTLDLNGFALIGPDSGSGGYGIYANEKANIIIMNGTVRDFMDRGILINDSTNILIKDIHAYSNGNRGIQVDDATVINCTASSNGNDGIHGLHCNITNCIANSNGYWGIYGCGSTITNCMATGNVISGIYGLRSAVTNCTARNNVGEGIHGDGSIITNCTAPENGGNGFYASESTITNCTAIFNDDDGIHAVNCNRIEGNNLRSNGLDGTGYGLYLSSSNRNYAIKNTAENSYGNFQDDGTNNYMPICGVDATDNCNYGF